ncbi:MAG: sugar phosphate isomerase/epimerase, partial [Bdellovibrionota bacterium]
AYGERIYNVHIKDRIIGGTTVPVGTGNTDFPRAFAALNACGYKRDFILQTCPDPDYVGIAAKYRQFTADWAKTLWT